MREMKAPNFHINFNNFLIYSLDRSFIHCDLLLIDDHFFLINVEPLFWFIGFECQRTRPGPVI